jgi:UDP-GlcNAc:undecaprenyl-phosphate GlcNAc-1-phosphate transferase
MIFLILIPILFITTSIFLLFNYRVANYFKILDFPNKRKQHSKITPLTGGILFIILFFESVFFLHHFERKDLNLKLYVLPLVFFFLGILDDKKDLNANIKLIFLTIISSIILLSFPELQIKILNFLTVKNSINFKYSYISILFTSLCILLLINACNMSDGVNGLFLGFMIIAFFYLNLSYSEANNFLILIIIILTINFLLNLKNKFFMGDSGVFFISTLLSIEIIKAYNSEISDLKSVEEIFLILMIPGIDMLRLFFTRLNSNKHPFKADNNHLHHIILRLTNNNQAIALYFLLIIVPLISFKFKFLNSLNSILLGLIIYLITFIFFIKKKYN